ncbi:ATP-binding protein [Caulobacter sp. S45]|uniref:hybrid sensor histidine kinase/response regulator n=1 Tax=Caulobacter sp. S45 TaxID=1641861 RepID=UPI0015754D91|nr:ATP-binding protein [Caulobacter sp. S45]
MLLQRVAVVCVGAALLLARPGYAQPVPVARWTPEAVAAAVERQALRTSFTGLQQFGREAVASHRADRLQRLEHVEWLLLNQSDFQRFAYWNGVLRAEARKAGDRRYVGMADLDALRSRYDQGDLSAEAEVTAIAAKSPDWFVRCHAMVLDAYFLVNRDQAASALHELADADGLAMAAGSAAARAGVWEIEGLALVRLQDLDGSAIAFGRSQFEFGQGYPRPDYDGIWNMAKLAVTVGRQDLAQTLYEAHHRLSLRSDLTSERPWDDQLCATVAEGRDAPADVLGCLAPLGPDFRDAQFIAPLVLPGRAIAYARLGDLVQAQRDLATLMRLRDSKAAATARFERLPEVQAEIEHAAGQDRQAFDTLRTYTRTHDVTEARAFSLGVGQLTGLMARQMTLRQLQLSTAQKNLALADRVVRDQRLITLGGGLIGVAVLALLAWQVRVSRQLRSARAEAEAGSRAKGEFLANMSHEIRTPLNGLLTMAEVMERGALADEQRRRLAVVRQSGRDLLRLLNDILDFSKIEAGKLELEEILFDPAQVLESTLAGCTASAEAKDLQLRLEVAPDACGLRRGDPSRLRQIVANFLGNALKFTVSGGVHVRLTGYGEGGREGLQLAVQDTGVGIAPDKMRLLFQKFSQVDASTTRRFGGTGLGLAICQELATMMGGAVWAESVEGQGSTFYATLALPYAGEVEDQTEIFQPADAAGPSAAPLRLLAAEDNPTNQLVLSTIMQMFGFELTLVGDGERAVEAWRAHDFDAILMDVQMPVMDGVQATRAIRAAEAATGRPRTPIIALSANAFSHQVSEYLGAGMDAHVAKPIELAALQSSLEAVLANQDTVDLAVAV